MTDEEILKLHAEFIASNPRFQENPSLLEMGQNLINDGIKFLRSGCKIVDKEERKRRLDICQDCPFYENSKCKKCGCNMKIAKMIAIKGCPIGKWDLPANSGENL